MRSLAIFSAVFLVIAPGALFGQAVTDSESEAPPAGDGVAVEQPENADQAMRTAANERGAVDGPDDQQPAAEPSPSDPPQLKRIPLREFLVLPRVDLPGRRVLHQDPIDAAIANGDWRSPQAGDLVTSATGDEAEWEIAVADAHGRLSGPATAGGYAFATVDSPAERVMLLEASHHVSVCVNGDWLAGDIYGYGGPHLPVKLVEGENTFLFHVAQPGFNASLVEPDAEVRLTDEDATLPDLIVGGKQRTWAAVPVVNASASRLSGGELRVTAGDNTEVTSLPPIEPMTVYKARFRIPASEGPAGDQKVTVALHLPRSDTGSISPDPTSNLELTLSRVDPTALHTRTFISQADDSVQAYSVLPATGPSTTGGAGMIVAMHDIGVDHRKFLSYFEPKSWAHVVAPQNRRPVGFVWEDWGADSALEAIEDAAKRLEHDPQRVSITGHGYGGYGAWRLAMRYPDRFAAIGPSGASVEYFADPGPAPSDASPVESLLRRGAESRSTAGMLRNLSSLGIYILHGADDRRSPSAGSRFIRSRLGDFHTDFVYYERPGAGHWWGPQGVDWPAMGEFFQNRRIPDPRDVDHVDFTTPHPSDGAGCFWVSILGQETAFQPSRVVIDHNAGESSFSGRTENVSVLSLDLKHLARDTGRGRVSVRLDDSPPLRARWRGRSPRVWFAKNDEGQWKVTRAPAPTEKFPSRSGPFKNGWRNDSILVYGTQGTDDENRWTEAKARYDAQSFWRRGNGSLEVIADTEFDSTTEPNRSVVLYGNAQTNAAWPALLSTSPVQMRKGQVEVTVQANMRPVIGEDLSLLMVRPRPGSRVASVTVVGGTGLVGMRATNRLRYFVPGVVYPDLLLMSADALTNGDAEVRAAGYFGPDWGVGEGEILWRDLAL